jgi:hypothetical protein
MHLLHIQIVPEQDSRDLLMAALKTGELGLCVSCPRNGPTCRIVLRNKGPLLGLLVFSGPNCILPIVVKQPGVVAIVVLLFSPLQLAVLQFKVEQPRVVAIIVL